MRALVAVVEGLTASFRHPHFVYGRQPSFGAPTPTAIYGLLSAAWGDWIDARGLRFACRFRCLAHVDDVEHLHILTRGSGRLRPDYPWPVNLEGQVTPFRREVLAFPRLELALASGGEGSSTVSLEELAAALSTPRYALSLGRSQDLATVTSLRLAELRPVREARLEPGLYPSSARTFLREGYLQTMPTAISVPDRARVEWGRFIELHEPARVVCEDDETLWAESVVAEGGGPQRERAASEDDLPLAFVFMPLEGRLPTPASVPGGAL